MEPMFYKYPYNYYFPNRFRTPRYMNSGYYGYSTKANKIEKNYLNENNENHHNFEKKKTSCDARDSYNSSKPIFEIFGIKLFFDDVLLISLIFFLYSEDVKDQSLFIVLILLLLS